MSAVIEDVVVPVRTRKKQKSLLKMFNIKGQIESYKFNKVWADRNIYNGELIIDSLELDPIIMDQYMFVEENKQIVDKLQRIGFEALDTYPTKELFGEFSTLMYNSKYNVAISVYKSNMKKVLETAHDIAEDTEFSFEYKLAVFVSAVKMLNK